MNSLYKNSLNNANVSYSRSVLQNTNCGFIEGFHIERNDCFAWLGVPYAKPPIGDLRWKAPREIEKWEDVLQTKSFGNDAIQRKNGIFIGSEDCLYLNIYRPNTDEVDLPVLFWVHGGGNKSGNGSAYYRDILATRANCVIVTINYRLNALGWFAHPSLQTGDPLDDSGNYAILDILKALEWVQQNIACFGGDKNNVTMGGQSAGARNLLGIVISPLGKGLFHKTMILSGGTTACSLEEGYKVTNKVLIDLLLKDGIVKDEEHAKNYIFVTDKGKISTYLRGKSAEEVWGAFPSGKAISMEALPHIFTDGHIIPKEGFEALETGKYIKTPMILGSTENEFSSFAYDTDTFKNDINDRSILLNQYKKELWQYTKYYGGKIFASFNVENIALKIIAHEDQPPLYAYRFGWGMLEGVTDDYYRFVYGCRHSMDLSFLFCYWTNPNHTSVHIPHNEKGREALSEAFDRYVRNFLYTGNPNDDELTKWNNWTGDNSKGNIMKFNATAENAVIECSEEVLLKNQLLDEFEEKVPKDKKEFIKSALFKGRFFWEYYKD